METDIWKTEQALWLEGAEAYRAHVAPSCLMAFPQIGLLEGQAIVESLASAGRWTSVEMDERRTIQPAPDVRILAYRATASRGGDEPYAALCTSTYVLATGEWKIAHHHQSPAS